MKNTTRIFLFGIAPLFLLQGGLQAWDQHALISEPVLASMPQITRADSVTVISLEAFLLAVESELAVTLSAEEQWARENLEFYPPLPPDLVFQASGNAGDIRQRFINAIRINPDAKLILYEQLLPGTLSGNRTQLPASSITPLHETGWLDNVSFVALEAGEKVTPLEVLITATDELDMGMDVGLYENNGTEAGQRYGLGSQPFGNPNLEYGSQAPLHMGLYHEGPLVNRLAPFLTECLPEYRIHLYKILSELAFKQGQDYWGWRFMGWGLHYIADLAQPYHTQALPGVGFGKMMLMNVLDMLGFSGMKDRAVQLVSNRHTAIESLERQLMEKAYIDGDIRYLHRQTLSTSVTTPVYSDELLRTGLSQGAQNRARLLDRTIGRNFPAHLVSDPSFELSGSVEQDQLLGLLEAEDPQALSALEKQLDELLLLWSTYGRSYVLSIQPQE